MAVSTALKPLRPLSPRYVGQSPEEAAAFAVAVSDRPIMSAAPAEMRSHILLVRASILSPMHYLASPKCLPECLDLGELLSTQAIPDPVSRNSFLFSRRRMLALTRRSGRGNCYIAASPAR